jgi:2-keto-4-pentenoate hydratase/2-oxohepta-3-ene-1,7-dioic acid hydratase in catechol pathway
MIQLTINGEVRQEASTDLMIRNTFELVSLISRYFTLYPGDVVLTGTPSGAGILPSKSVLQLNLDDRYHFKASLA